MPNKKTLLAVGAAIAAIVLAVLGGSAILAHHDKAKAAQYEQAVAAAKGEAKAHREAAQASDAKATELATKVQEAVQAKASSDERASVAERKVARLKAGLGTSVPGLVQPGDPLHASMAPVEGVADLQAAVEKRDEVIAAQDEQIAAQKEQIAKRDDIITVQGQQIAQLTTSRDEWKTTAKHLQDQADAQALATAEYKKAMAMSELKTGIKYTLIGAVVGALAGSKR